MPTINETPDTLENQLTYSLREVFESTVIAKSTLKYRADKLRIPYRERKVKGFLRERYFMYIEVLDIVNYNEDDDYQEIIYVHTTWMILESKLNFEK